MATTLRRTDRLAATIGPFASFFEGFAKWNADPSMANFAVGNPQEMPLPGYVDALHAALRPQDKDWFAYKMSEPNAQAAVARSLTARTGLDWDPAGRRDDEWRLRRARRHPAGRRRARRRGRLPVAAVVLLRAAHRRRRWRAGPGPTRPAGVRPRCGGDRGRDHAPHPGGPHQHPAEPDGPDLSVEASSGRSARCSPAGPRVATARSS